MMYPNRVISVDFETTGLNTMYDSPTSISCVAFEDGEPTGEVFDTFIRVPLKTKISIEALCVQGADILDPAKLAAQISKLIPPDAPDQKEAMAQLFEWVNSNGLHGLPNVSHKATFDWGFYDQLNRNTSVYTGACLSPTWVCTKTMAQEVMRGQKGALNLATMCARYGIEGRAQEGHNAREDAVMCGRLYFAMKAELEAR